MNRGQGFTAGALVLSAALLHPGTSRRPVASAEKNSGLSGASVLPQGMDASSAEGPWVASCNYWRPSGTLASSEDDSFSTPRTKAASGLHPHLDQSTGVHPLSPESASPCSAQHWGVPPSSTPAPRLPITALMATLPDPVHSSLALDFDRLVDAITQGAADNNYLISYYWLPWNRAPETTKAGREPSAEEIKQPQEREKQPGLLILKPGRFMQKPRLIYMFLVAQTPALGVNGAQMRNALAYESALRQNFGANLSIRDPVTGVDIIGPNHSGSADSLRAALLRTRFSGSSPPTAFHVVGTTSTLDAANTLEFPERGNPNHIDYISFGEDTYLEQRAIRSLFSASPYGYGRLAVLTESGTAFGSAVTTFDHTTFDRRRSRRDTDEPIVINFPREISLLRNAQKEDKTASNAVGAADPYLHLSLKSSGTEDTIAHFSTDNTPFSQEAQWMSIVRELKERHVEVVSLSASNILDELFLAKYLRRDLPNARLVVFEASDLLFARVGDNAPYVGTIAATAYPMVDLTTSNATHRLQNFASTWVEQYYNAVSYTLWDGENVDSLSLSSYALPALSPDGLETWVRPPPLWMTVVGRDGYYPLSIVDPCSSNNSQILPVIRYLHRNADAHAHALSPPKVCTAADQDQNASLDRVFPADRPSYPGFSWYVLCLVVILLCIAHTLVLRTASFWSPTTRDLAIEWSDEPRRRAVYLHIAAAMLFSISVVAAVPALFTLRVVQLSHYTLSVAALTLAAGVLATGATVLRTWPFLRHSRSEQGQRSSCHESPRTDEQKSLLSEESLYPVFHGLALLAAIFILTSWCLLCSNALQGAGRNTFVGVFFAFRCLYPASGVSPALPVLLILLSWYLWAFLQTKRLRFSSNSRPMLPHKLPGVSPGHFVPEEALTSCSNIVSACLFENATCLLITRQLIRRVLSKPGGALDLMFATLYGLLFTLFTLTLPIRGLDHFLRPSVFQVTLYQFVISALFYPLLVVAVTGFVRMGAIWTSLRSGLLEPLERSPLRFSFSRLTNVAWMTMFKQNGVFEYFRGMARSNQSMRQMTHSPDLAAALASFSPLYWKNAISAWGDLEQHIATLLHQIEITKPIGRGNTAITDAWNHYGNFLNGNDLPDPDHRAFLNLMCAIECDYSKFCEALLAGALIPYWTGDRLELVEAEPDVADTRDAKDERTPKHIQLAEEFLALRYLSLIRALLINLRQLMTFVSVSFVLALLAWNSYPFQQRQGIDWIFTGMLLGLGAGIIWIFAQMHRDPILSRITGTEINKLGASFYLRLATFGAVPVLTWVASQFPEIGSALSRLLQSGMAFAK